MIKLIYFLYFQSDKMKSAIVIKVASLAIWLSNNGLFNVTKVVGEKVFKKWSRGNDREIFDRLFWCLHPPHT
jgi:hypothetical protein